MKKPLPAEGSVYDWVFDLGSATWKKWMDTVPAQAISPDTEFSRIVVTTTDVVRYSYLIQTCVEAHNPLLVVGPTGTGKERQGRWTQGKEVGRRTGAMTCSVAQLLESLSSFSPPCPVEQPLPRTTCASVLTFSPASFDVSCT